MRRLIYIFIFLQISVQAQENNGLMFLKINNHYSSLEKNFDENICKTSNTYHDVILPSFLPVVDIITCKKAYDYTDYNVIKTVYNGNFYYYEYINKIDKIYTTTKGAVNELSFSEAKPYLEMNDSIRASLLDYSRYTYLNEKEAFFSKFENLKSKGLAILKANATDETYSTGAEFKVINLNKKTIKYITFTFHGENAVEDKVYFSKGVLNTSKKGIGPIEYFDTASYEFDYVWNTSIVEYLILKTIKIEYMDKTFKTLNYTNDLDLNESDIEKLEIYSKE